MLASGHWPVPLKQLVQISVQKLIKEVFWSVEHQIIQQFSYLPKKVNTRALAVYIKKSGWPENWSGLYAAVPLSCISSCTTTSCINDTGTSMSRFNRCQIFSFENPHYCELCMFRTSNRSTLRILGGSSHPGLLRRRLTKWIHRELWIVNLHVSIKYWDILLFNSQSAASSNQFKYCFWFKKSWVGKFDTNECSTVSTTYKLKIKLCFLDLTALIAKKVGVKPGKVTRMSLLDTVNILWLLVRCWLCFISNSDSEIWN